MYTYNTYIYLYVHIHTHLHLHLHMRVHIHVHTYTYTALYTQLSCLAQMQANAEPDLQQTGNRLKPIVAGLIEGIMQLVVDPLAQSHVSFLPCSCYFLPIHHACPLAHCLTCFLASITCSMCSAFCNLFCKHPCIGTACLQICCLQCQRAVRVLPGQKCWPALLALHQTYMPDMAIMSTRVGQFCFINAVACL